MMGSQGVFSIKMRYSKHQHHKLSPTSTHTETHTYTCLNQASPEPTVCYSNYPLSFFYRCTAPLLWDDGPGLPSRIGLYYGCVVKCCVAQQRGEPLNGRKSSFLPELLARVGPGRGWNLHQAVLRASVGWH